MTFADLLKLRIQREILFCDYKEWHKWAPFESGSLESLLQTGICERGHQLILLWVTCRGHSKITHEVPHSPWKKRKKIYEFSEKPHLGSLHRARNPSPAQSPFWNLKWADQAKYGWACISVTFFTSLPLSDTSKVMASERESHRTSFLEASMSGKQLWGHGKRFRRPGFKPRSCPFLIVSLCHLVSVLFIS